MLFVMFFNVDVFKNKIIFNYTLKHVKVTKHCHIYRKCKWRCTFDLVLERQNQCCQIYFVFLEAVPHCCGDHLFLLFTRKNYWRRSLWKVGPFINKLDHVFITLNYKIENFHKIVRSQDPFFFTPNPPSSGHMLISLS